PYASLAYGKMRSAHWLPESLIRDSGFSGGFDVSFGPTASSGLVRGCAPTARLAIGLNLPESCYSTVKTSGYQQKVGLDISRPRRNPWSTQDPLGRASLTSGMPR